MYQKGIFGIYQFMCKLIDCHGIAELENTLISRLYQHVKKLRH